MLTGQTTNWRFSDPRTGELYPAAVAGPTLWRPMPDGWCADIELGALAAGLIVTPSLSVLDDPDYQFQFELHAGDRAWQLPPVPNPTAQKAPICRDAAVKPVIDCWHIERSLPDARIHVSCRTTLAPRRYLLNLSTRPITLGNLPAPPDVAVSTGLPPGRSQMLENPRIASRICSPISVAMTLAYHRPRLEHHRLVAACHDPLTGMYGLWPLAIRSASQFGTIGSIEMFSSWEPVVACLEADLPVVASVRYASGQLPGTAKPASGGHLVVVHGITGDSVLINDPAAAHHGAVNCRCPLPAFAEAWFRHRGAAYILLP